MKDFNVYIYHSGYSSYRIKAKNEDEAIEKARELPLDKDEILATLEPYEIADEACEVEETEKKSE